MNNMIVLYKKKQTKKIRKKIEKKVYEKPKLKVTKPKIKTSQENSTLKNQRLSLNKNRPEKVERNKENFKKMLNEDPDGSNK